MNDYANIQSDLTKIRVTSDNLIVTYCYYVPSQSWAEFKYKLDEYRWKHGKESEGTWYREQYLTGKVFRVA